MSRHTYPKYKPSGLMWLQDVPSMWSVTRLRFQVKINPVKSEIRGMPENTSVSFVPMEAVGEYGGLRLEQTQTLGDVANSYTYFRDGDVVVAKITPCFENGKGSITDGLKNGIGFGTTELHVLRPSSFMDRNYLFYLTISHAFRKIGASYMYGAGGQKRVPDTFIRDFRHPIPATNEQRSIAAFLDRETARIDALIEKKRRQIELLQEKRSALISHAVTKGLDPNAKMKDSGIEWLGEIPKHWQAKRLRFAAKVNPVKSEVAHLLPDTEVSFVPMEAVNEYGGLNLDQTKRIEDVYQGYTYFRDGDVVIAKITPCFENGKGSIATGLANGVGFGTTELYVVRPLPKIDRQFFFYLSISIAFRQSGEAEMYGAGGQKRVPDSFIRDYRCPLPPMEEQQHIVAFLDSQTDKLDAMMEKINRSIDILREYRTALISAAVTGKIDVRKEVSE